MHLSSLRQAIGLLRSIDPANPASPPSRSATLATGVGPLAVDLYEPPSRGCRPNFDPATPTVIVQHGLSLTASRDPRFLRLATAFAAQGFRIVAPSYPSLLALQITPQTIAEMVAVLNALADGQGDHLGPFVPPGRPVAVFAISFSAGLGMVATSHPDLRLPVSCQFHIGGYCDLSATLDDILSPPTRPDGSLPDHYDDYGRLVVLHNWLDQLVPEAGPALRHWLMAAIRDNLAHQVREAPAAAAALTGTDALWHARLANPTDPDIHQRVRQWSAHPAMRAFSARLSPGLCSHPLTIPTWLMHGRTDPVISCQQTLAMARRLRRDATPVRTLVTDGISHAGAAMVNPLRLAWEQLGIVRFTAQWIQTLRRADTTARAANRRTAARSVAGLSSPAPDHQTAHITSDSPPVGLAASTTWALPAVNSTITSTWHNRLHSSFARDTPPPLNSPRGHTIPS